MHFDWTISLSTIVSSAAMPVLLWLGRLFANKVQAILNTLDSMRDAMRDMSVQIGSVDDGRRLRSGILGALANIQDQFESLQSDVEQQREWLLLHGYDRRSHEDRRQGDSTP